MTIEQCYISSIPDDAFVYLSRYSRYRRYPGFSIEDTGAIAHAESGKASNAMAVVSASGIVDALAYLYPLDWDSSHFGRPMYRLDVLSGGVEDVAVCRSLVEALLRSSSLPEGAHISAEIDIDDYCALNGVLACGFEILDLRRTYCTNRMRQDIDFVRMRSRVRYYRNDDHDAVMALVRSTRFPSRFLRDSFIPLPHVVSMYEKWFAGLLEQHGSSSNVVVYERHGEVVGCGAIGEKTLYLPGREKRFRTGSLYAGRPDAVGAYTPVLYQLIVDALQSHGLVDTTVSLNNVTVCRVLEGFRSYKSAAASYSTRKVL